MSLSMTYKPQKAYWSYEYVCVTIYVYRYIYKYMHIYTNILYFFHGNRHFLLGNCIKSSTIVHSFH